MALMNCPECGHEVSDQARFCPVCGLAIQRWIIENKKKNEPQYVKNIKIGIIAFFIFALLLGVILANISESFSYRDASDYTYTTTTSSNTKIDNLIKELKNDGWTCFTSGSTFDKCVKTAHTYLKTKYNEDFYNNSVVVSTKDASIYYVSGWTKSGKALDVSIIHSGNTWGIIDATLYD